MPIFIRLQELYIFKSDLNFYYYQLYLFEFEYLMKIYIFVPFLMFIF